MKNLFEDFQNNLIALLTVVSDAADTFDSTMEELSSEEEPHDAVKILSNIHSNIDSKLVYEAAVAFRRSARSIREFLDDEELKVN